MRHRIRPGLAVIDAPSMLKAIAEFNEYGRMKFLKRYGLSRSSKFYLIHRQRLYDTKALVAAAYRHATGKRLQNTEFAGGAQTGAVFVRLANQDLSFAHGRVFEDKLGELRNLSAEYDRIPRAWTDLRELGFSKWIPLENYADLNTGWLPGVYVIANSTRQPFGISVIDKRVVYIRGASVLLRTLSSDANTLAGQNPIFPKR
jgi:5-methylcytosine-specific restriction protein A